jgi:hypothetical protein
MIVPLVETTVEQLARLMPAVLDWEDLGEDRYRGQLGGPAGTVRFVLVRDGSWCR